VRLAILGGSSFFGDYHYIFDRVLSVCNRLGLLKNSFLGVSPTKFVPELLKVCSP
jgi:hypothetical protein